MKKIFLATVAALVCFGLFAGTAMAGFDYTMGSTHNMSFTGCPGQWVEGNVTFITEAGTLGPVNGEVGQYRGTETIAGISTNYFVSCIEGQYSYNGVLDHYTVAPLEGLPQLADPIDPINEGMGAVKANYIRELFTRSYNSQLGGTVQTKAAFQLAVWELVYDGKPTVEASLGSGNFSTALGTAYRHEAWDMLNALTYDSNLQRASNVIGLTNPGYQDFIMMGPAGADVPVPGTLLLCCIGLGFAAVARRFRRS